MAPQGLLKRFLIFSAIVFISAILAKVLASQSGDSVYIWPPAGFAVAVGLSVSLGRVGWASVLLGTFLACLAFSPTLHGLKFATLMVLSLSALGLLASAFSRSFLRGLNDKSDLHILAWLLKVGPLACLLPAAIVTAAHHLMSAEQGEMLFHFFVAWWLGNTLGVLLFAPVALVLNRSAQIKLAGRQDTTRALIMLGVLIALLVVGNYALMGLEKVRMQRNQQVIMDELASNKFRTMPNVLSAIEAMRFYIYASEEVTPQEFAEFSEFVAKFPAVQNIHWVKAGEFNADAATSALAKRAVSENRLLVAPVVDPTSSVHGNLIAVAPVLRSSDDGKPFNQLRGYVVAQLSRDALIAPLVKAAKERELDFELDDVTQSEQGHVIATNVSRILSPVFNESISFGGLTWRLQMASDHLSQQVQRSEIVLLFRGLSVLITLGAVVVILGGLSRTVAVLRKVQHRTQELEERLTYQLEAEAALKQQEEDLNVTLQALGEAVITTDARGNIVRMNRVAETLTGWSQTHGLGERASVVFCLQSGSDGVDAVPLVYPVTEAISHKTTVNCPEPLWMVSRSGVRHLVRYIAAPLLEKERWVRGAVLVFRSVSDEENEHAKVAQAEKRFRSIIERTPTAIAMVRGDVIEFINPRMRKLLGIHRSDGEDRVLGTPLQRWVADEYHQALAKFRMQDEAHHLANEIELNLKRYDDAYTVTVKVSVGSIDFDSRHQFLLFKEVNTEQQNRFDTNGFFNLSPDLICMADDSGYLKQVNPIFLQTLGWSQRELLAQPLLHFVHPEDVDNTRREIGLLEAGEKVRGFINRCLCKNGDYRWMHWKVRIAHRGEVFAIARDVTDHMELHEQLKSENAQLARELRLKEFALNSKGGA